jgi:hypothetical protein
VGGHGAVQEASVTDADLKALIALIIKFWLCPFHAPKREYDPEGKCQLCQDALAFAKAVLTLKAAVKA